jgi:hypothetical protein
LQCAEALLRGGVGGDRQRQHEDERADTCVH